MNYSIDLSKLFKLDKEYFIILNGRTINQSFSSKLHYEQSDKIIRNVIKDFGQKSAKSQNLKQIITTPSKFISSDQRMYIKTNGKSEVLGFIKVGERNLFYHDYMGKIKELYPTCVLDIYVHESCQRNGLGKEIFEKFLKEQHKLPQKLAYDRPSDKLLSFLKKHYNLVQFIAQNNNYVIFDQYFTCKKIQIISLKQQNIDKIQQNKQQKIKKQIFQNNKNQDYLLKLTYNIQKEKKQIIENQKKINMKQKNQSSFGCPWAKSENIQFHTTYNTYGNYYFKK